MNVPNEIARIAITTFGDSVKAERWLRTPIPALNDDAPIARVYTDEGIEEVIKILEKIECGEFS